MNWNFPQRRPFATNLFVKTFRVYLGVFFFFSIHILHAGEKDIPVSSSPYKGAASCAASSCHGGTKEENNEYSLWSTKDKHRQAYQVLFQKKSVLMGEILQLEQKPHEAPTCLECHATTDKPHAKLDLSEGVGCEACHGASGAWFESHTRKDANYHQNVALGMTPLRDLTVRSETCLRCHSGVDHRLLSAGHPNVTFELDTFSAMMPQHWRDKSDWPHARAWLMGQTKALSQSMTHMESSLKKHEGLDEAFMNCYSCHHNIYDVDWPLTKDSTGKAKFDASRYVVFRKVLRLVQPEKEETLTKRMIRIDQIFRDKNPKIEELARLAGEMRMDVESLSPNLERFPWSAYTILTLIGDISKDTELFEKGGFHAAEQALMSIDALTLSLQNSAPKASRALRQNYKTLFNLLDVKDPAYYRPEKALPLLKEFSTRVDEWLAKTPPPKDIPWWTSTEKPVLPKL